MVFGIVIGLLSVVIVLLVISRSNYKSRITFLEAEIRYEKGRNSLSEGYIYDLRCETRKLEFKIKSLQTKNFCVGATFFYPRDHNFKDEIVGKRAKIVEITNEQVKSRLIDGEGNFIDEMVWTGSAESALTYIYENNCGIYFKFR